MRHRGTHAVYCGLISSMDWIAGAARTTICYRSRARHGTHSTHAQHARTHAYAHTRHSTERHGTHTRATTRNGTAWHGTARTSPLCSISSFLHRFVSLHSPPLVNVSSFCPFVSSCIAIQCNAMMRCDAMRCTAMRRDATRRDAMMR